MESELTQLEEKQKQEVAERVIETTAKKEVYITDDETLRNEGVADLKKLLRSYKNG
jgi:type III secretion system FlhB-like substrate exporter